MRIAVVALLLIGLGAPGGVAAPPGHGACPTITDPAGDTGFFVPMSEPALDITAVDIDVNPQQIVATIRVVGQPERAKPEPGQQYELYVQLPERGTVILRANIGKGKEHYRLFSNIAVGDDRASAQRWTPIRDLTGRIGQNSVTIIATRGRDLPVQGFADVFARTWMTVANEPLQVAGMGTREGFASTRDDTSDARLHFGRSPACRRHG